MAAKFKKGDKVIVIAGSDKGKIGDIIKVVKNKKTNLVEKFIVSGVKIATMHKKPTNDTPGQRVKVEKPIHISNISHIEDGKAVKIKFKIEKDEKTRVSKKTDKKIG